MRTWLVSERWKTVAWPLVLIGLVVAAMAGVLYYSQERYEDDLVRTFQKNHLATARSVAGAIKETIFEVEQDLRQLTSDPDIVEPSDDLEEEVESYYENHQDILNDVNVVASNGQIRFSTPWGEAAPNLAARQAFNQAKQTGKSIITGGASDDTSEDAEIRVFVPIGQGAHFRGGICGCISLDKLWSKSIALLSRNDQGTFWIIDNMGRIIYGPNPEFFGQNWREMDLAWHRASDRAHEGRAHRPTFVDKAMQGTEGVAECCNALADNDNQLIVFAPIDLGATRYHLIGTVDKDQLTAPIAHSMRLASILMGGLVVIFLVVGFISYRSTVAQARFDQEQRFAAERHLAQEQNAYMGRILDDSLNEIYIFNVETLRFVQVNRGAQNNLGYGADELQAMTPLDIKPELTAERFAELVQPLRDGTEDKIDFTTVHRRKDGSMYPVDVNFQLSVLESRPVFVAIILDITERKKTEAELNARAEELTAQKQELTAQKQELTAQKQELAATNVELNRARLDAEAASRAKSEFLANMSHEIRTPMTAILGFADVLYEGVARCTCCVEHAACETRRQSRDYIETIRRNCQHLLGIINDILDLSKIEAGKFESECVTCSPIQALGEVYNLMRVRSDAKGLMFEIVNDSPIPQLIQTDPVRLKQILVNLVGNAVKFTEQGFVRIEVRCVDGPSNSPTLEFDVVDSGISMTPEQSDKLFQAFTQADASTTREYGGTGLGLAISQRLAQVLGGDIQLIETQVGVGSRFRLTLPTGSLADVPRIVAPDWNAESPQAETLSVKVDDAPLADRRILLAEDGPDNQRLISHLLRKAGAQAEVTENGQEALDAAIAARDQDHPFDVILMDMQMPVMDGYEATRQLRENDYAGAIIALTAHAMAGDRERCLAAGCDDYITKPVHRKALVDIIQKTLAGCTVA